MHFSNEEIKTAISTHYDEVASSGCGCKTGGCCDSKTTTSLDIGYTQEQLDLLPKGADATLGCGNPTAIASLQRGDTVLDLGSGAGIDCFLASREVGEEGSVIGVDMTPKMIEKSRKNKDENGYDNVEFRLGEIENLPVADDTIDVIISNCVINLSLEKQRVFDEAYRVLKKGGRLALSDIVLTKKLPIETQTLAHFGSCIAGASSIKDLRTMLHRAGFKKIRITPKNKSKKFLKNWSDGIENNIVSAYIQAVK